MPSRTTR
ncbi:dff2bdaf-e9af-45f3-b3bc-477539faada1 [Thermothielavioides terrestris]|nr:dff2bdaf-e9af-45f3-b3bc-477539faada1 [Thermothielavioides terrestris]